MERLGKYQLEKRLATGGMAEVYLAKHPDKGAMVVKCLLDHLSDDTTFVEMFLDEARLVARLADPGIARIYDIGVDGHRYYLAMEYISGSNLSTVLEIHRQRGWKIPIACALRVCSVVATALHHAHTAADEIGRPMKIIHRDVSPQNIMISTRGEVKLIDFGIAKAATASHRTAIGTLKGKFAYMSPEQLRQQSLDHRTDLYSLGLVLYELLAGEPAVRGTSHAAVVAAAAKRSYPPIEQVRPETPPAVRAVLAKALALSVDDRFANAGEMAAALEQCLQHARETVTPQAISALLHLEVTSAQTNPEMVAYDAGADAVATRIERHGVVIEDDAPPTVAARRMSADATTPRVLDQPHEVQVQKTRIVPIIDAEIDLDEPDTLRPSDQPLTLRDASPVTLRGDIPVVPYGNQPTLRGDIAVVPDTLRGEVPAALRGHDRTDPALIATDPQKEGPDIPAAMARPARSPSKSPLLPEMPPHTVISTQNVLPKPRKKGGRKLRALLILSLLGVIGFFGYKVLPAEVRARVESEVRPRWEWLMAELEERVPQVKKWRESL